MVRAEAWSDIPPTRGTVNIDVPTHVHEFLARKIESTGGNHPVSRVAH